MATPRTVRLLLVSDLDDTLLGDDQALARFRDFHAAHRDRVALVYASGRFCTSIQERIDHTDLPEPAATIGGVGSEIWSYPAAAAGARLVGAHRRRLVRRHGASRPWPASRGSNPSPRSISPPTR